MRVSWYNVYFTAWTTKAQCHYMHKFRNYAKTKPNFSNCELQELHDKFTFSITRFFVSSNDLHHAINRIFAIAAAGNFHTPFGWYCHSAEGRRCAARSASLSSSASAFKRDEIQSAKAIIILIDDKFISEAHKSLLSRF